MRRLVVAFKMEGGNGVSVSGAEPHGQVDKVFPPKKPVLAQPNSNQVDLVGGITHSPSSELRNSAPVGRFNTVFQFFLFRQNSSPAAPRISKAHVDGSGTPEPGSGAPKPIRNRPSVLPSRANMF